MFSDQPSANRFPQGQYITLTWAKTVISFASEEQIRASLPHTWHAFFARFPRLRDVQRASILPILSGKNVLVNAPTASGKTEAILAPVIERYLITREKTRHAILDRERLKLNNPSDKTKPLERRRAGQARPLPDIDAIRAQLLAPKRSATRPVSEATAPPGPFILIIAPTKALCNDLYRRLLAPVQASGISVAVKTGDTPSFQHDNPPTLLITTPESLDSMLSRQPHTFLSLQTVVLDEIHLMSASGRGDQLQCLLTRIRRIHNQDISFCASSATVPDLERIAREFLGEQPLILSVQEGTRSIAHEVRRFETENEAASIIASQLLESPTRKMIVFANTRALVENLVLSLRQKSRLTAMVFAHHGSLSKEERLRTEKHFFEARHAVCVATSTLELGIDIGDVDRIVLVGPPSDVSSLVQRIGRGNRKEKVAHVICLAVSEFDAKRFHHLVLCAQKDQFFYDPVRFRPTTLVQQAFSICLQNPNHWVAKNALFERISDAARKLYTVNDCEKILEAMAKYGYLRRVDHGKYVPDGKTPFLFDRGYMHSMILDRGETDVIDVMTGRNLGSVTLKTKSRQAIAEGARPALTLGGKSHEVSYMRDKKLYVEPSKQNDLSQFNALEPPRYSLKLAQDFAHYLNIPQDCLAFVPENKGYRVDHYLGTIGACFICDFLTHHGCQIISRSHAPFYITVNALPVIKKMPNADQLKHFFEGFVMHNFVRLAQMLQPGPWFGVVAEELIQRWILSSLDLNAYAERLANLPISLMPGDLKHDNL